MMSSLVNPGNVDLSYLEDERCLDLLLAVIDSPDDDALRLAIADWLEERGYIERALLIRSMIKNQSQPSKDDDHPCRQIWAAEEAHALAKYTHRLSGRKEPDYLKRWSILFKQLFYPAWHRGFPAAILLGDQSAIEVFENLQICAFWPIETIHMCGPLRWLMQLTIKQPLIVLQRLKWLNLISFSEIGEIQAHWLIKSCPKLQYLSGQLAPGRDGMWAEQVLQRSHIEVLDLEPSERN